MVEFNIHKMIFLCLECYTWKLDIKRRPSSSFIETKRAQQLCIILNVILLFHGREEKKYFHFNIIMPTLIYFNPDGRLFKLKKKERNNN